MREGLPLPETIQNAPTLLFGLDLYFTAFLDLSDSRSVGMGLGPIPWKVVHDYCEALELSESQTEAMHHHIRVMDAAYLEAKKPKGT